MPTANLEEEVSSFSLYDVEPDPSGLYFIGTVAGGKLVVTPSQLEPSHSVLCVRIGGHTFDIKPARRHVDSPFRDVILFLPPGNNSATRRKKAWKRT